MDGNGLVHQPSRWPCDLLCAVIATISGVVYREQGSPAGVVRSLRRKAVPGGDVEGLHQQFRGTGGEGWHHRGVDGGICIQEGDMSWSFLRVSHQEPPEDLRRDQVMRIK